MRLTERQTSLAYLIGGTGFVTNLVKFSVINTRSTCSFHASKLLNPSSFIGNWSLSVHGTDDDDSDVDDADADAEIEDDLEDDAEAPSSTWTRFSTMRIQRGLSL